jgi:stage II sporulation protein AA (anti-sigma F factor antagonist)
MPLHIEITRDDAQTYKVRLTGSLDSDTVEELDRRMVEVWADNHARTIRMELQALGYISSMGLGLLAKFRKAMVTRGGTLLIIGAQPQVARVFEIVKMLPKETVFASWKEADEYLAAIQKQVKEGDKV